VTSSATPGAERTPPPSSGESSAGGSRLRRWRRDTDGPELADLDADQATELVRRSAQGSWDQEPVSARTAELLDEDYLEDDNDELDGADEVVVGHWPAATERVIAQAIATGMTDPDELPEVRRGILRRRTGYYSPQPPRPVVDPDTAVAAGEHVHEMRLPRRLRRELERATKEMTDAAEAAHAAREAAERAAAAHAEQTARAQAAVEQAAKGREAAERAAREQAFQARTEAQRREVAEQLASESVEQMAAAAADRIRVEEDARRQAELAAEAAAARMAAEETALRVTLEREAAEARAQAHAEAAAKALEDRSAAEARAQELAASLEEARAALLEQTQATLAAPTPPEPRIQPEGVPDLVELRSPSSSAVITVLLGLGALVAAGIAVYEAYLDRLTTPPGLAASAVTILLVVIVGRARGAAARVWLEQGVLHVEEGDSHRRFDLTTPSTKVEMIGRPGARRWKVLFLRKGMAPYELNAGMVDPVPFVEAIRPYRPRL